MDGELGNATGTLGQYRPLAIPDEVRSELASATNWRQQAQQVQTQAHVFYLAFKHPRTPWYARLVAVCTAGYLFSPIQLIPSFVPVIGFLDDFLVLFLGVKLLQKITPPDVLAECRQHADDAEVVAAIVIATRVRARSQELRVQLKRGSFWCPLLASWGDSQ